MRHQRRKPHNSGPRTMGVRVYREMSGISEMSTCPVRGVTKSKVLQLTTL